MHPEPGLSCDRCISGMIFCRSIFDADTSGGVAGLTVERVATALSYLMYSE